MEKFDFEKINDVISKLIKSNPKNLHTSVTVNSSGTTDSVVEFEFSSLRNSEINDIVTKILESAKETWDGEIYLGSEKLKLIHVTSNILSFKVDTDTFVEMINEGELSDSINSDTCELYTKKIPMIVKSIAGKVGETVPVIEYHINIYQQVSSIYDSAKGILIGVYSGKSTDLVSTNEIVKIIIDSGYIPSLGVVRYCVKGAKGELAEVDSLNLSDSAPKDQAPQVYTFAELFEKWRIGGTSVDVFCAVNPIATGNIAN